MSFVPFDDLNGAENAIGDETAAVIVEPIQGEGGVRSLPQSFIEALCELCDKHGTLLVADEVQTALGRSGHFVNSAQWPRAADIICMGKALGGGLMPGIFFILDEKLFKTLLRFFM